MKAIWKDTVVAESDETIVIEGNHYFPPHSVNKKFLQQSATTSECPWKGAASYYNLVVGDEINSDAAWYYAEPKNAAQEIKGYIAFWKGVQVLG